MNKSWLGYLSSALFLIAGIFEMVAQKWVLGILFVVLAIANFIINNKLKKINNK